MSIYLAARYSRKQEIDNFAKLIEKAGFEVGSTWHSTDAVSQEGNFNDENKDTWRGLAKQDLKELEEADILIMFTESPNVGIPRGGRHVEYGFFLHRRRHNRDLKIYIIGPVENLFNYFADEIFADTATFIYEQAKRLDTL